VSGRKDARVGDRKQAPSSPKRIVITSEMLTRAAQQAGPDDGAVWAANPKHRAARLVKKEERRRELLAERRSNLGSHLFSALVAVFLAVVVAWLIFYAPSWR